MLFSESFGLLKQQLAWILAAFGRQIWLRRPLPGTSDIIGRAMFNAGGSSQRTHAVNGVIDVEAPVWASYNGPISMKNTVLFLTYTVQRARNRQASMRARTRKTL